jgi:hypothetical protein
VFLFPENEWNWILLEKARLHANGYLPVDLEVLTTVFNSFSQSNEKQKETFRR